MTFTITLCHAGWTLALIGWSFIFACLYGTRRGWYDDEPQRPTP